MGMKLLLAVYACATIVACLLGTVNSIGSMPTPTPTPTPTRAAPTPTPTPAPAPTPTPTPSPPTPTPAPATRSPTSAPTLSPTLAPSTLSPSLSPTVSPTASPTLAPTTASPTLPGDTNSPSETPTSSSPTTSSPSASPTTPSPTSSVDWSTQTQALLDANDYAGAIEVLLAVDPKDTNVYNFLGYSYRSITPPDYVTAESMYMESLALKNDNCGAREYLGELYLATDRLAEAENQLEEIQRLCPDAELEQRLLSEAIAAYTATSAPTTAFQLPTTLSSFASGITVSLLNLVPMVIAAFFMQIV